MALNPPSWLQQRKSNWSALFFKAFLFTLPFQSSLLIYEGGWGRGFANPYITISLSLAEVFLILSAGFFLKEHKDKRVTIGKRKLFWALLGVLAAAALSLLISPTNDPELKFFLLGGLMELMLVYLLIVNKVLKVNEIFRTFTWSMSFQAALALAQLALGHSLGLGVLGEPSLDEGVAHLAKLQLGSWEVIRSYGTFGHPNILGGFMALSILGTLLYPPASFRLRNGLVALQLLGLLSSFSRSALLALSLAVLILSYRSVPLLTGKSNRLLSYGFFLLLGAEVLLLFASRPFPLLTDPAIQARIEGYKEALHLFEQHPLGVGWNMETLFLDERPEQTWMPWEYQPTHNVFILAGVETGPQGLLAFLILIGMTFSILLEHEKILGTQHEQSKKNYFMSMGLVLLLSGCLDHYWLTLEPARFLAVVLFASISRFLSDPVPIHAIKKGRKSKPTTAIPK